MEDLALSPEMDGPYDTSSDAFYEEIEAPKFVDLTDKNPVRVDDRYWFCSRVGCDQKHEEELDSEEVYKNFVLRVMAARSPNVRLQKALSRRCGQMSKVKCSQSAPPKSTRPQVSRVALVSSTMVTRLDGLKSKSIERGTKKVSVTPKAKVKVVESKYMTTPRNKNPGTKYDAFRSLQKPKGRKGSVGEVRSRVAKTLVFHSPKKTVKLKASLELKTPVRKMCEKLKKLEIDEENRKKQVLGYSPKKTSASKLKATPIRPWRVDKKVELAENKKKSKEMAQPCDKLSKISNENQVSEIVGKVGKQEELQDAKAAEKHQSTPLLHENVAVEGDDDKENESGTDQNRCNTRAIPEDPRPSTDQNIPTSEQIGKRFLKVTKSKKNLKAGTVPDAQGLKCCKLKPTNPKPFRLRTDERSILKEAHSGKRALSIGKCYGQLKSKTESEPASKKIAKLKSNAVKEVKGRPGLARINPSIAGTTPLEHRKAIAVAKTPEKPKSILLTSAKRKTVTPSRENVARKPTVSFLIPGEKTPEASRMKHLENPGMVSSKKLLSQTELHRPKAQLEAAGSSWNGMAAEP